MSAIRSLFFVFALILFGGCEILKGSGVVIEEFREVDPFNKITMSAPANIILKQVADDSDDDKTLVIVAEDNIMKYVDTQVIDEELRINLIPDPAYDAIHPSETIQVYIWTKDLEQVSVSGENGIYCDALTMDQLMVQISGSSKVVLKELSGDVLRTDVSGTGELEFSGTVTHHIVSVSGSATIVAEALRTEHTDLNVSGILSAAVLAEGTLDLDISGSATVRWQGDPSVTRTITGSADLNGEVESGAATAGESQ